MEAVFLILPYLLIMLFLLAGRKKNRARNSENPDSVNDFFLSVLIPFRNEEKNLPITVTSLLKQSLPAEKFEIIWIDDRSDDGGEQILSEYIKNANNQRIIKVENSAVGGKRNALKTGMRAAKGDVFVFTDADCRYPRDWLLKIFNSFVIGGADIYCGPVIKKSNGILGLMTEIESFLHSSLAESLIGGGIPTLAFGANWAVKKDLLLTAGGYSGADKSLSGDDDLLLQKLSEYSKTIHWDETNSVVTGAPENVWQWIRQKRRHIGAGRYYNWKAKIFYAIYHIFYLLIVLSLFVDVRYTLVLLLKITLDYFYLRGSFIKGKRAKYLAGLFLFQFFYVVENWIIGLFGLIFQTKRW